MQSNFPTGINKVYIIIIHSITDDPKLSLIHFLNCVSISGSRCVDIGRDVNISPVSHKQRLCTNVTHVSGKPHSNSTNTQTQLYERDFHRYLQICDYICKNKNCQIIFR